MRRETGKPKHQSEVRNEKHSNGESKLLKTSRANACTFKTSTRTYSQLVTTQIININFAAQKHHMQGNRHLYHTELTSTWDQFKSSKNVNVC